MNCHPRGVGCQSFERASSAFVELDEVVLVEFRCDVESKKSAPGDIVSGRDVDRHAGSCMSVDVYKALDLPLATLLAEDLCVLSAVTRQNLVFYMRPLAEL